MPATFTKYVSPTSRYATTSFSPSKMASSTNGSKAVAEVAPPVSADTPVKAKRATVYGASYCKPCAAAKKHLASQGVEVRFVDINEDEKGFDEMASKLAAVGLQPGTIPVIEMDGKLSVGFDAAPSLPEGAEVVEAATGKSTKKPAVSVQIKPKSQSKSYDWRYPATVGVGIVGGATIGYWAFEHAYKAGMTKEEKRQIAGFSLAMSIMYLTSQMPWGKWFNIETAGEEIDKAVAEAVK